MELRSTGNPDTSNPVTMSMSEYMAKKGREAMSEKTLQRKYRNCKKKCKVKSAEIVVRKINEKPYYEIKYFDLSDNEYHIGYGSYKLEYVFEWLEQCFEIAEKNTNADKIRNMNDEELADFLFSIYTEKIKDYGFIRHISGRSFEFPFEVLEWLKQSVED